jgi:hypothetical protein
VGEKRNMRPTVTGMRCLECGRACYFGDGRVLHVRDPGDDCPWNDIPYGHYYYVDSPSGTRA